VAPWQASLIRLLHDFSIDHPYQTHPRALSG
jgi:hypothetical protein